jgi:indole-3-glycerol phosphate synthase
VSKLDEICAVKRAHVAEQRLATSEASLRARIADQSPPRGFRDALIAADGFGLIAEIKKASPSKGLIRADFDPPAHARAYQAGGAACLSILTDAPFFQGANAYLETARPAVSLPCLRKDFMVDPWQVLESRAIGADAILIIVAALDDVAMAEIEAAATELGMDVLVEVHDRAELDSAARLKSRLIGVNNRNLKDFSVDLAVTESLVPHMPAGTTIVAESGLATHDDLQRLSSQGVRAFLVGEALMRQDDVAGATRALLGG